MPQHHRPPPALCKSCLKQTDIDSNCCITWVHLQIGKSTTKAGAFRGFLFQRLQSQNTQDFVRVALQVHPKIWLQWLANSTALKEVLPNRKPVRLHQRTPIVCYPFRVPNILLLTSGIHRHCRSQTKSTKNSRRLLLVMPQVPCSINAPSNVSAQTTHLFVPKIGPNRGNEQSTLWLWALGIWVELPKLPNWHVVSQVSSRSCRAMIHHDKNWIKPKNEQVGKPL